jgi:hypothetical protein
MWSNHNHTGIMKTRSSPRSPHLFSPDPREWDYPSVRTYRVPVRIYLISSGPTRHIRISAYSDRMLREDCIVLYRNFSCLWNIQDQILNGSVFMAISQHSYFFNTHICRYTQATVTFRMEMIFHCLETVHTVDYKSRHVSSCKARFTFNSNICI